MSSLRYLVDTSVLGRARQPQVGKRLEELLLDGKLWTCRMVDLEYTYSKRARDVAGTVQERSALPEAPVTPTTMDAALAIMAALAEAGHHRGARPADCVIAACAQGAGLTVLHYDRDFDHIADVTGLQAEWVAPAGSLDG
jgi:predicted nucleic acid-binding protein